MDKIIDIKKLLEKTAVDSETKPETKSAAIQKVTNPILKKLLDFHNERAGKFSVKDLFKK